MRSTKPRETQAPSVAAAHHRYLATDHLLADLKGRAVRGGAITLVAQGIKFVLQLGSIMVLARMLTPADFGLIAMVTAVTGFVAMFKDAGLSMATVQREHITHEQVSTLFWINVALSVLVMLVIAALAPAIALFYSEPRLTGITLALAATFIFGGLTVQHQALLRRQMHFRALATVEILSMAAGVATAIAMAFAGFGYWSLVGLVAGATVANSILVWVACGWRPGPPRRRSGVRPMLGFGGALTASLALNHVIQSADYVILGRFVGAVPLGLYTNGRKLLVFPGQQFSSSVSGVVIPALSRANATPERFCRLYLAAVALTASVTMPPILFMVIHAEITIHALLGTQWASAAPYVRILGVAYFLASVHSAPGWLCIARNKVKRQLLWATVATPFVVLCLLIGVRFGGTGVAAAFAFGWTVSYFALAACACHGSPVRLVAFVRALAYGAGPSLIAGAASIVAVGFASGLPSIFRLAVAAAVFAAALITVLACSPSRRSLLRQLWHGGLFPRASSN